MPFRLGVLAPTLLSIGLTISGAVQANTYPARIESIYLDGCKRGATQTYKAQQQNPDLPRISSYCRCTFDKFRQRLTVAEFSQGTTSGRIQPGADAPSSRLTALKQQVISACALRPR